MACALNDMLKRDLEPALLRMVINVVERLVLQTLTFESQTR